MDVVGIDPSQRHTGLCLLREGETEPRFYEIQTGTQDIMTSSIIIEQELKHWMRFLNCLDTVFCLEKSVSGGFTSALLFHVQMVILKTIEQWPFYAAPSPCGVKPSVARVRLVWPLPVQLKSYMQKMCGVQGVSKEAIVARCKQMVPSYKGRMSSHKADAYFLARLGKAVIEGRWSYKLSEKELRILPNEQWEIINGNGAGDSAGNPAKAGKEVRGVVGSFSGL